MTAPRVSGSSGAVVKRQRATDADGEAEALRVAEEHGAAEAAKRTGVPAATRGVGGIARARPVRRKASIRRAGKEQRAEAAREAWQTAQEADHARKGLDIGEHGTQSAVNAGLLRQIGLRVDHGATVASSPCEARSQVASRGLLHDARRHLARRL